MSWGNWLEIGTSPWHGKIGTLTLNNFRVQLFSWTSGRILFSATDKQTVSWIAWFCLFGLKTVCNLRRSSCQYHDDVPCWVCSVCDAPAGDVQSLQNQHDMRYHCLRGNCSCRTNRPVAQSHPNLSSWLFPQWAGPRNTNTLFPWTLDFLSRGTCTYLWCVCRIMSCQGVMRSWCNYCAIIHLAWPVTAGFVSTALPPWSVESVLEKGQKRPLQRTVRLLHVAINGAYYSNSCKSCMYVNICILLQ